MDHSLVHVTEKLPVGGLKAFMKRVQLAAEASMGEALAEKFGRPSPKPTEAASTKGSLMDLVKVSLRTARPCLRRG